MHRIISNQPYLDITSFETVEFKDIMVLTGVNGSGKTHLLEGIQNGHIHIYDNHTKIDNIVYFNYMDFIVKEHNNISNHPPIKFRLDPNAESHILANTKNYLTNNIDHIKSMFDQKLEVKYIDSVINHMIIFRVDFLENIIDFNELFTFLSAEYGIDNILPIVGNLTDLYEQIISLIDKNFKHNADIKYYLNIGKGFNKTLYNLGTDDFKPMAGYLGQQIWNEFRDYRIKQYENDNLKLRKNRGELVSALDDDEFIKLEGPSPRNFLNDILKEYDINGFFIDESSISYPPVIRDFKWGEWYPTVTLNKNTSSGETIKISISQLSSGEKTLLALAILVYQRLKHNTSPRCFLLDEIDANLHPSIIHRLLNVLQKTFIREYNACIIYVTHSPTTVALIDENCLYIMNKEGQNRIEKANKKQALSILTEGYMTYQEGNDIYEKILASDKNFVLFVEGDTDAMHINNAIEKLGFEYHDIEIFSCDGADNLKQFLIGVPKQLFPGKVLIGLLDYDEKSIKIIRSLSNFDVVKEIHNSKIYRSRKANNIYIFTLPFAEEEFIKFEYAPIEFLYNIDILNAFKMLNKRNVYVLNQLEYIRSTYKQLNPGDVESANDLRYYSINEGEVSKKTFAEACKKLTKDDLSRFKLLFDVIKEILKIHK